MTEKLFYRKLYEDPSSNRTRGEIDSLRMYLSAYNPIEVGGFSVGAEEGHVKYRLNNNTLVKLTVQGNFSIMTLETEKNCRGLLKKLREFYTEVRVKSLE